jgi:hypothetical protein
MLLVLSDIPKRSWTLNAGHRCLGMGQQTSAETDQFITAVCASLGKVIPVPEPVLGVAGRDRAERCGEFRFERFLAAVAEEEEEEARM